MRRGIGLWAVTIALGVAVWTASRVVGAHPEYAAVAGLAVLVFSALVVARPVWQLPPSSSA